MSKAKKIEWVTLISQDGYTFVMDKRHARCSIFIRSMLGEEASGGAGQRTKRSAIGDTAAAMSDVSRTIGASSSAADAAFDEPASRVHSYATPPPDGEDEDATASSAAAISGGPEGYANPFASANDSPKQSTDFSLRHHDLAVGSAEAQSNTVRLPQIRGVILEKVVEFLCWKAKYQNAKGVDIPNFEHRIPPEIALELLMVADYLLEA